MRSSTGKVAVLAVLLAASTLGVMGGAIIVPSTPGKATLAQNARMTGMALSILVVDQWKGGAGASESAAATRTRP